MYGCSLLSGKSQRVKLGKSIILTLQIRKCDTYGLLFIQTPHYYKLTKGYRLSETHSWIPKPNMNDLKVSLYIRHRARAVFQKGPLFSSHVHLRLSITSTCLKALNVHCKVTDFNFNKITYHFFNIKTFWYHDFFFKYLTPVQASLNFIVQLKAGLKFAAILLAQLLMCWDHKYELPCIRTLVNIKLSIIEHVNTHISEHRYTLIQMGSALDKAT